MPVSFSFVGDGPLLPRGTEWNTTNRAISLTSFPTAIHLAVSQPKLTCPNTNTQRRLVRTDSHHKQIKSAIYLYYKSICVSTYLSLYISVYQCMVLSILRKEPIDQPTKQPSRIVSYPIEIKLKQSNQIKRVKSNPLANVHISMGK